MNEMVDTLFDYAKLGTEAYEPKFADVDICALVREIVAENYCDFEEHGIDIEIDIPDEPIMIKADRTQMKRALGNLVVNIFKHNPDGIKAKAYVGRKGDKSVISFADSGSSLPTDMDIFEPFVTENTARTAGRGTGLGLAITKRIIERHGGKINTENDTDGYTKMFVIRV